MDAAIRKAQEQGIGIATARRSNHFGAAGHYAWLAAERGLIGLCTTNGPPILAPSGGITPTFGNNPIAAGIPAGRYRPILLDVALSVAPRGKIGLAIAEGRPLPHGWILDDLGRPSTDLADLAAGLGVPIGGHKGYGLAMVMEILAGALSGARFSSERRPGDGQADAPNMGHCFIVIDPARFMPSGEFVARVDALIEQTKCSRRSAEFDEILVPGERELRCREESLVTGVRLRRSTYQALVEFGLRRNLTSYLEPVAVDTIVTSQAAE